MFLFGFKKRINFFNRWENNQSKSFRGRGDRN